ncbi:MAG: hypothetical protein QGF74_00675 [Candidatus Nanoarchaeia archaeon]|nr:hypothetical protein [Candidatus Nanoarchaeia archaeon]
MPLFYLFLSIDIIKRGEVKILSLDRLTKKEKLDLLQELVIGLKKDVIGTEYKKDYSLTEIPSSIFNEKLGSLESIVKYLRENLNIKISKIASLLNRNDKTIWATYNKAKKKYPEKFKEQESKANIPVSIISSRKFSVLESIVYYLKENYDINFHEIALILKRNDRTIWTVYQKAKKKESKK